MALKRTLFTTTFLSAVALSAAAANAGPPGPLIINDGNAYNVSGPESVTSIWLGWTNGAQTLNVLSGGSLTSESLSMGVDTGASGNFATVYDGGTWTNSTNLIIGDKAGGNTFTIDEGGTVGSDSTWLGFQAGSGDNDLFVSGTLTNSNQLVVGGDAGGNMVSVGYGGSITSLQSFVGYGATGGSNSITVSGAGSLWANSGVLRFGYAGGNNTLDIVQGGKATVGTDMVVGQLKDSGGNTLEVSGTGSELNVSKTLYVGQSSDNNSLTVSDGGLLTTTNARIGGGGDAVYESNNNSVTVTGSSSKWTASGKLRVGDGSSGHASSGNSLTVTNGGQASFTEAFIGFSEIDEDNSVFVTGEGSSFVADLILVGASNIAKPGVYTQAKNSLLEVTNGASVTTSALYVGGDSTLSVATGASVTTGYLNLQDTSLTQPGATLKVALSDTDPATITADTAVLGGTLEAEIGAGGLLSNRYDVITYNSYSGAFTNLLLGGYATNYTASIGYDPTAAYVLFNADLGAGEKLNRNQRNVAGALDDYFNSGGVFTSAIAGLYGLTGDDLKQALTDASGELGATGGVNAIERATTSFLNLMLGGGGQSAMPGSAHRMAQASSLNTGVVPTADVPPETGGWSMWGGVYGGAANLPGSSSDGSHDTDTTVGGIAAGFDYDVAPDTRIGVAIAGGQTSWDLDAGLGNGDSTFVQLGGYGTQRFGASYLSLGAAYAWHSMSTDRRVNIDGSEKLDADFDASNLAGRIEAGHRFAEGSQLGVTPYAAFQAQTVWMPGYHEHTAAAADDSFAVSYKSNTATALRSELGIGLDTSLGMDPAAATLFGRVAWAHDWNSDANVQASFVSLDMGTFTVYGADTPDNIALVTAGAEFGLSEATRLAATFDGEFGSDYQSYAGSLTLRYSW